MTFTKTLAYLLGPLAMTLTVGCASAYHSPSGCHVDCQYCAPPPLPYASYDECACHSYAASQYLAVGLQSNGQETDTEVGY